MNTIIMFGAAIIAIAVIVFMLVKKMDITMSLFLMGLFLMWVAIFSGNGVAMSDFSGTGITIIDPIKAIGDSFKGAMNSYGFTILILGGYTTYMSNIGANDVTVSLLTKPIGKIKSAYLLVPVVFLLGNLLSLVIPSASNLSIILLATLYPVLRKAGMSTLTAAGIIATTATVIPTPLGSDNVAIAAELANTIQYAGMSPTEYVFRYHAIVSIPTLFFMAFVHLFWQKFCDRRLSAEELALDQAQIPVAKEITGGALYKTVYALLPLLPIFILLVVFAINSIFGSNIDLGVEVVSILSFFIALVCETVRNRSVKSALDSSVKFFAGMGGAMPVVALTVAATVFVTGLSSIGLIDLLKETMTGLQGSGMGFVLPLILVLFTALIVILSGSGTSVFFAMVPLMVPLTAAAGISVFAVTVPMGLAGNLLRAVSPVAAVVMIVSGTVKKGPLEIVKRTSVPMIAGTIFMFILSMVVFL